GRGRERQVYIFVFWLDESSFASPRLETGFIFKPHTGSEKIELVRNARSTVGSAYFQCLSNKQEAVAPKPMQCQWQTCCVGGGEDSEQKDNKQKRERKKSQKRYF